VCVDRKREYRYPLCWILFYSWNIIDCLVTSADLQVIIVVRVISGKRQSRIMIGSVRSLIANHKIKQNKETGQVIGGEEETKSNFHR
jgi:hypothetical protein